MVIMKCYYRKRLVNPAAEYMDSDYYMYVGCGRCYPCLSNRRRQWLFRLGIEALDSFSSFFVTLTYSDDTLPSSLCKSHLLDFLEQINFKHKYYAIGEYGSQTFRPHYHVVLFAKEDVMSYLDVERHLTSCWNKGFVTVSNAYYIRLNYILHYHVRPKNPILNYETFALSSKGLGRSFLYDKNGDVKPDLLAYLSHGGRIVQDLEGNYFVIPRYYTRKLEDNGLIPRLSWDFESNSDPLVDFISMSSNNLPLYRISDERFVMLCNNLSYIDNNKLFNYNVQNKFHSSYV